jgi:predicted metal-dependent phosphoesterase TrpH
MSVRVDLHTHSYASPDGALRAEDYRQMLASHRLSCIAVTDHNTIDFAQQLHAGLGDSIIVGEEITTAEGEIIGLYLQHAIEPGKSALETAQAIRAQQGLVYIPHPFETVRKGITLSTLNTIADYVDIIEAHNGRAVFQNYSKQALLWSAQHHMLRAAASDAHGLRGWGKTYSELAQMPTSQTLLQLLATATLHTAFPGVHALLYPKINRLRKGQGPHA